jgi:HK97 family phage major capsid protein
MTIAQLESDLRAKTVEAKALLEKTMRACQEHVVKAATGDQPAVTGRLMTEEERGAIAALTKEAEGIKVRLDRARGDAALGAAIDTLTDGLARHSGNGPASAARPTADGRVLSLGAQFVADETYKRFIRSGGHRHGAFTSPGVEVFGTLLTEGAGSGGALVPPDRLPGLQLLPQRRLVVADLIAPGTTESNLIQYVREKTFTNAADAVLEGGTKPESALVYELASSGVTKIAHWIPVTEELLEDFAQTQSIVDARLRDGLLLKEEDELLNGSGTAPHLKGFLSLTGLAADVALGAAPDTTFDAVYRQIAAIATTSFAFPDGIVMNPADFAQCQLMKNAQGNYLGSGPWAAAQTATMWGLPVALTPAIVAGTALVGAYRTQSQIFRRGGIRVESSNSHSTFFVENKVAIRGEERLAFVVYREGAFGKVTGI